MDSNVVRSIRPRFCPFLPAVGFHSVFGLRRGTMSGFKRCQIHTASFLSFLASSWLSLGLWTASRHHEWIQTLSDPYGLVFVLSCSRELLLVGEQEPGHGPQEENARITGASSILNFRGPLKWNRSELVFWFQPPHVPPPLIYMLPTSLSQRLLIGHQPLQACTCLGVSCFEVLRLRVFVEDIINLLVARTERSLLAVSGSLANFAECYGCLLTR